VKSRVVGGGGVEVGVVVGVSDGSVIEGEGGCGDGVEGDAVRTVGDKGKGVLVN
jgi:hypothetical protein